MEEEESDIPISRGNRGTVRKRSQVPERELPPQPEARSPRRFSMDGGKGLMELIRGMVAVHASTQGKGDALNNLHVGTSSMPSPPGSMNKATPPPSNGSSASKIASPPSTNIVDREHPLHDACTVGDLAKVKQCVEQDKRDINEVGVAPQRWCPLHCAAVCGRGDVAKYLLEQGAFASAQDGDGWTPLHLSASNGQEQLAALLLEWKANVALKDNDGFTPLHEAARTNRAGIVRLLLAAGSEVDITDAHGAQLAGLHKTPTAFAHAIKWGRTPLHWAAGNGHLEVLEALVEANASVEAIDSNGDTPLHLAALHGHTGVVEFLIKNGAEASCVNMHLATALHLAASNGHHETVSLLHTHAPEVRDWKDKSSHTALHLAVFREHTKTALALLQLDANPCIPGPMGYTPLHYAARLEQTELIAYMVQHGATLDDKDDDGWTALHLACMVGGEATAVALVQHGAALFQPDSNGVLPLHVASPSLRSTLLRQVVPDTTKRQPTKEDAPVDHKKEGSGSLHETRTNGSDSSSVRQLQYERDYLAGLLVAATASLNNAAAQQPYAAAAQQPYAAAAQQPYAAAAQQPYAAAGQQHPMWSHQWQQHAARCESPYAASPHYSGGSLPATGAPTPQVFGASASTVPAPNGGGHAFGARHTAYTAPAAAYNGHYVPSYGTYPPGYNVGHAPDLSTLTNANSSAYSGSGSPASSSRDRDEQWNSHHHAPGPVHVPVSAAAAAAAAAHVHGAMPSASSGGAAAGGGHVLMHAAASAGHRMPSSTPAAYAMMHANNHAGHHMMHPAAHAGLHRQFEQMRLNSKLQSEIMMATQHLKRVTQGYAAAGVALGLGYSSGFGLYGDGDPTFFGEGDVGGNPISMLGPWEGRLP